MDQLEEPCHAEVCFLGKIRSWNLDQNQHHRLTCFISWSPCYDCAQKLTTFLKENRHISLHILASRIYTHKRFGCHQSGLCELQAAGARITIMTFEGGAIAVNETGFVSCCSPVIFEVHGDKGYVFMEKDRVVKCTQVTAGKVTEVELPEALPLPIEQFVSGNVLDGCGMDEARALTRMMELAYGW